MVGQAIRLDLVSPVINITDVSLSVGLKFLVRLCTDMNLKEAQDYANRLKKAEKMQKLREEVHQIHVSNHLLASPTHKSFQLKS